MSYKYAGRYQPLEDKEIEELCRNKNGVVIRYKNEDYHYVQEHSNQCCYIKENQIFWNSVRINIKELEKFSRCIVVQPRGTDLFVMTDQKLLIYGRRGRLLKVFEGESVKAKTNGFLVEGSPNYFVSYSGDAIIIKETGCVLEFISDKEIFYVENRRTGPGMHRLVEHLSDGGDVFAESFEGVLRHSNAGSECLYDRYGPVLLNAKNIKIYKGQALIDDVIATSQMKISTKSENCDAILVLSTGRLCVIYRDIVVEKKLKNVYFEIDLEEHKIHNFLFEETFLDVLFSILYAYPVDFSWKNANNVLEDLICTFLSMSVDISQFVHNSGASAVTPLCKVYRLTDDGGRRVLDGMIDFKSLGVDDLRYVVIYKESLVELFVELCKKSNKLFYLPDLVRFYDSTNRIGVINEYFLMNGILPVSSDLFDSSNGLLFGDSAMFKEIESQRLVELYSLCTQ